MAVTSGFFNSFNRDRVYDADQMSAIFDGIINDGVFANIGDCFEVTADSGNVINIGVGRAWFNSRWLLNDAILPITADTPEILLPRYDAVVIEIDKSDSVRSGSIKIIKGTAASSPTYPTLTRTDEVNQYPIAYIYRVPGSSEITQGNITNMVGTSSCPYITAILEVHDIDNIIAQWQAQWDEWYTEKTVTGSEEMDEWFESEKQEFETWLESLQISLSGDVATNLASQIADLQDTIDTLSKEKAIYEPIYDSNNDTVDDNAGNPIQGRSVFTGDDGGSSDKVQIDAIPVSYVNSLFDDPEEDIN